MGVASPGACSATVAVNVMSPPSVHAAADDEAETSVTVAGAAGEVAGTTSTVALRLTCSTTLLPASAM